MYASGLKIVVATLLLVVPGVTVPVTATSGALAPHAQAPHTETADLVHALAGDGTFRGAAGISGTIDASAWSLVSDLAAGEEPRFAPANSTVTAATEGWSALGSDGAGDGALNAQVGAFAVSGSDLFVGGSFQNAAGIPEADFVARWDGSAWSALGSNGDGDGALGIGLFGSVSALAVLHSSLYVGGQFNNAAGIAEADKVARWDGTAWSALGSNGAGDGALNSSVFALDVSSSFLYVGGGFSNAAGIAEADRIARWNGIAWSALGSNGAGDGPLNSGVRVVVVSGSDLLVGGDFTDAAGIAEADRLARWNGSTWSAVGSNGAGNGAFDNSVIDIAVSGSDLLVVGAFRNAAGIPEADFVARWDGSAWSALGSDGAGDGAIDSNVFAVAASGSDVFVGGGFLDPAGIADADRIARWDGSAWSALGSAGAGGPALDNSVLALATSGDVLFVGGFFTNAAGIAEADRVASWRPPVNRQPDGRIRIGTSGSFIGNNVYNTTAAGQSLTASGPGASTLTFHISVQNDGDAPDRLRVKGGGSTPDFTVTYRVGTTDVTGAVVAGTHRTPVLAVNKTQLIKVTVRVKNSAPVGSRVARKVIVTSTGDPTKKDAVKFVARRS